jgi:hypothetical protein
MERNEGRIILLEGIAKNKFASSRTEKRAVCTRAALLQREGLMCCRAGL